jgi:hypothetical protein
MSEKKKRDAIRSLRSESLAWNKNEQNAESGVDEDGHRENHEGSLSQEATNVWLANPGEAEGRVLAVANEG